MSFSLVGSHLCTNSMSASRKRCSIWISRIGLPLHSNGYPLFRRSRSIIVFDMQLYHDYETITRGGMESSESAGQSPGKWNTCGTLLLEWQITQEFRHNLLLLTTLERVCRVKDQVKVWLPNLEAKRKSIKPLRSFNSWESYLGPLYLTVLRHSHRI